MAIASKRRADMADGREHDGRHTIRIGLGPVLVAGLAQKLEAQSGLMEAAHGRQITNAEHDLSNAADGECRHRRLRCLVAIRIAVGPTGNGSPVDLRTAAAVVAPSGLRITALLHRL